MRRPQAAHSPRHRRAAAASRLQREATEHKPVWHSPPSPKRPAAKPRLPVYQPYQPPSPPRSPKKDPPAPPPTFARISGQHIMASDTDGPDVHDRAFRAALAEALSLARDPRHVVALSRVYAHAVGASDPDDPLARAALAAADVAVAEDLAAPTPRVVRRPSSPYSPVRVSSGAQAVSPVSPVPSVERATSPGVARVLSVGPDARRPPSAPAPPVSPPPSIPAVAPGVVRVPSPDPDARRRRTPSPEPESDEPDVMPCHKAHRKELRDRKRQEERRFRKLLAKVREESEQRTPHKGTSRQIARVMRDLAAATAALDAASRISQQEEEEAPPPRFRGPLREDAAVEKRRVALELPRDMRCGR